LILLYGFPEVIAEAGFNLSPALIANYIYELVKNYNQFYHDFLILKEVDTAKRDFRIMLTVEMGKSFIRQWILLGIEVPERM